ncbi:MAG: aminodeoxychorismate synthase component I [Acidimicrobiales bacterium]
MKTLLIDNYDSFTFNLYQILSAVCGRRPVVVKNDEATWDELQELDFDNVVISPGPGRPEVARDFGVCADVLANTEVPLLGVCLGHQGLCHHYGATVDYAPRVMHGRGSAVHHDGSELFEGIPSPFTATRYHSLHVRDLPDELEATAWTAPGLDVDGNGNSTGKGSGDRVLMAVRHRERPVYGVQFHPESICTEFGHRLLANFRNITERFQLRHPESTTSHGQVRASATPPADTKPARRPVRYDHGTRPRLHGSPLEVYTRRIPFKVDAETAFMTLYADAEPAFWLDSALVRGFSRFSYMGDATGPHAEFVTYSIARGTTEVTHRGATVSHDEHIFDYLNRTLAERHVRTEGLPFDFNGGYAGYLGYELKAHCGGSAANASPTDDAAFVFADRLIAFDHEEEVAYLVCIDGIDDRDRARRWINDTYEALADLQPVPRWSRTLHPQPVPQVFRHTQEQYLDLIAECKRQIAEGETYEVCLTNMIGQDVLIDPVNTYRALRERNPAPYATFLRFPEVSVLSSSPERFLTVGPDGEVESKPIKGTRPRGTTPEEDEHLYQSLRTDEKDRSENLMIVDLLRNDIGELAEVGSVHVSRIFSVESYATVHQLVSTVRGRLRPEVTAVDAVRRAFPGGSMTGAPKIRTMEIIDRLEAGPRGIYSGSIGFFGLNGSTDLSIVIRTIVMTADDITIGVGGAIVDLSDPHDEVDEMLLKAKAVVAALSETDLTPRLPTTDGHWAVADPAAVPVG